MKITVNINRTQLNEIIFALQNERPELDNLTIIDKVYFCLFNQVFKKLLKKQIDKADDRINKPFKIEMEYPLAAALLNEVNQVETTHDYRKNCIRILKMDLRQKIT